MKHLIAVLLALSVTACGGGIGASNVAACKSLVSKLQCGTAAAPLSASTCDGYINTTCDYATYFRCIEGAYVCTNNMYDPSKLSMAASCTVPTCR